MSGGGGSAPETTTTISKSEPPEYVKPYSIELMNRAGELSNADYQAYPGERIAPFTDQHMGGMQMMQDRAMYGDPMMDQAKSSLWNTMEGNYFGPGMGSNPYMGMDSYVGRNQYLGLNNPYIENQIGKIQSDMKENYDTSIAPYLDQQERRSGSFGNSGLQEMRGKSLAELNKNLGQAASDIRYGDYQNQLGLAEKDVDRNAMYNAQNLNRNMLGMENQFGRQQTAWGAERDQQMRAAALAPQYDTQYQDAMRMMGVGDVLRDYNQSQLNYGYDTWRQGQNWPYQQLDTLANAIRTSMGGGGSMVTSSPDAYSSNSTMGMLGGGMLGYGLAQDSGMSPLLGAAGGGLLGGLI